MSNEDGTIWITFNGEIYNQAALRDLLLGKGHVFQSRTDTEVIVHLYEEKGPECVCEMDGMFAFGLWDEKRRQLVLARDRLGKKPVYYTNSNGRLLFASEIKALLTYPGISREIDFQALDQYLTFSNVPAPRTLFAGISKLPAAHLLTCGPDGSLEVSRYWSPLDGSWSSTISESEAAEEVRVLVKEAVRKRLMADVEVGCFLSGGVDSSTNVALMSELMDKPLRTFSVGFVGFGPSQNFHDLPFARMVADRFGCEHREIMVTAEECKAFLPELVVQQDEPIGDPACLPMHFVSKAAHEDGIKVVLVGEGSDEVFGGYDDMSHILEKTLPRWEKVNRLPRIVRKGLHRASRLLGSPPGRVDLLRRAVEGQPLYWGLDVVFWETEKTSLLAAPLGSADYERAGSIVARYHDELLRVHPTADGLQQMSYVELCNRLPELLLMRVDKISMAHSIEARAPFLDYRLSAYALSLPQRLKIRNGESKAVLKRAVSPFLPAEILQRKKQGFRVPLDIWLRSELAPWGEELLAHSALRALGVFNFDEINRMWSAHRSGREDHSFDLWCLLNLAVWYDHWIEGRPT